MKNKRFRAALGILVVLATVVVFVRYFMQHPRTLSSLQAVSPATLLLLFFLYIAFVGTLVLIQQATLTLCNLNLSKRENSLLIMYSSIINFFGPLQSGPGFRAAYLKKRHNVNLKKYALATLVYYGLYALFSALFLLAFFAGSWVLVACVVALAGGPLIIRLPKFRVLRLQPVMQLALATLAQVSVQAVIYYVELRSLLPHVSLASALIYTGAANFALFVSLTPGAIGFRESFLLFSQKLHKIGAATIATASVIDRGVYVSLLVIMAILVFGMHANRLFSKVDA